jgi:hypothetical protein
MSDPVKDAWNEVAEGFSQLGQAMKARYRSADEADAGATSASGAEEGLREAFERFVAAGHDVGQRAVDVVRDADVNSQARQAAASLNDALSATVDMIGREVSGWFARSEPAADEPGVVPDNERPATGPTSEPPDEST